MVAYLIILQLFGDAPLPLPGSNCVVDISHYSKVSSVAQVKSDGIAAVICKATEGAQIVDKTYVPNRKAFKAAGFKWGSYHFSSGDPAILQAENYLTHVDPQNEELICLDYEPSFRGPNMTFDQMMEFITILHRETDRYPMIYGGSLLRETLAKQSDPILAQCPLWYAYYPTKSDHPIGVPKPWTDWTLWQYTDGNHGPSPQTVKGIGNCDRDTYNGTAADMLANWPFT